MNSCKPPYLFVTPSVKPTGGNLELIRLVRSVAATGVDTDLIALWEAEEPLSCGDVKIKTLSGSIISSRLIAKELILVCIRFFYLMRDKKPRAVILSHYVTYVLSFLIPPDRRWFFVQDTEWRFVSGLLARTFLRRFILFQLRRGKVLTANSYLTSEIERAGIVVAGQANIWANVEFASDRHVERDIDLVVMLRKGAHKRADLVEALLEASLKRDRGLRVALITPNDEFFERWTGRGLAGLLLRPTLSEMRSLYERSLTYVLLSEHEGFGLPPLEAMGAGVVPICRPAGGILAYMREELKGNIISAEASVEDILSLVEALKRDGKRWQCQSTAARRIFCEGLVTPSRRVKDLRDSGLV